MPNIFLIISLFSLIITKSLHSMEKKQPLISKRQRLPIPKFNELTSSKKNLPDNTTTIITTPSNQIINNPVPTIQIQPLTPQSSQISKRSKSAETYSSEKHSEKHKEVIQFLSKSDSIIETLPSSHRKKLSKSPRPDAIPLIKAVRDCGLNAVHDSGLIAVRDCDLNEIEKLINDPHTNPNQQDNNGNTALHHAILQLISNKINKEDSQKIISLLFLNPAIDSTISNKHDMIAAQLIKGNDFLPEIRTLLFAQDSLTRWIKREIENIILDSYINNTAITNEIIMQLVEKIKENIDTTESSQQEKLPETALVHATDEFIFNMTTSLMPFELIQLFKSDKSYESNRKNLNELFSQEICNILLNVFIDNDSIENSAEIIMNEISSNKAYKHLNNYITQQCVLTRLKTHVEQKKPNLSNIFSIMIIQEKSIKNVQKK